jgi:hypothetical protein
MARVTPIPPRRAAPEPARAIAMQNAAERLDGLRAAPLPAP